jgi:nucleotide-binding universal stress UspA family protein
MKILIAHDGSEGADAALEELTRAGLPRRAEALVVVTDVWLASSPAEFSRAVTRRRLLSAETSSFAPALREVEEERALSREAQRRLRALFPNWDVRAEAAAGMGTVASALLRRASTWGADLLVVGSGERAVQDQTVGAAVRRVVTEAPCSVRVVRPSTGTYGSAVRLLVAEDGPPGSRSAFRVIASRRWPPESECRVIAGAQPDQDTAETLRAAGLKVSTVAREGELRCALVEEAVRWRADCIFVGTHGRDSEADQHSPGGLITALVAGSPCSVEVARSSMRATAGAFVPIARAPVRAAAAGAG